MRDSMSHKSCRHILESFQRFVPFCLGPNGLGHGRYAQPWSSQRILTWAITAFYGMFKVSNVQVF